MKFKRLLFVVSTITTLYAVNTFAETTNSLATSPVETSQWIDDKGDDSKYSIVNSTKQLKGVADYDGNVILDTIYKDVKIISGWDKFAIQTKDNKWTITNIGGDRYFKETYDFVDTKYYKGGFIEIGNYGNDEFSNNIGILNKNMKFVVPVEYQTYVYTYDDELLVGKLNNGKYDYYKVNKDGSLDFVITIDGILSQNGMDGYYITHKKDCANNTSGKLGYISTLGLCDKNFNIIIEPIYENTAFSYNNDLAIVKKGSTYYTTSDLQEKTGNGKYGIIDRIGNEIVKCKYDSIKRTGNTYTFATGNETKTLNVNELYSNDSIQILLNGVKLNTKKEPYIKDNYTMLPLRTVSEALDAEVGWDNNSKTAIISKNGKVVRVTVGVKEMLINNTSITLPTVAEIIDGTTYIPLRSIATALDTDIKWDSKNKIVSLSK